MGNHASGGTCELDDDVWFLILSWLPLLDMARVARTSHRLHHVANRLSPHHRFHQQRTALCARIRDTMALRCDGDDEEPNDGTAAADTRHFRGCNVHLPRITLVMTRNHSTIHTQAVLACKSRMWRCPPSIPRLFDAAMAAFDRHLQTPGMLERSTTDWTSTTMPCITRTHSRLTRTDSEHYGCVMVRDTRALCRTPWNYYTWWALEWSVYHTQPRANALFERCTEDVIETIASRIALDTPYCLDACSLVNNRRDAV